MTNPEIDPVVLEEFRQMLAQDSEDVRRLHGVLVGAKAWGKGLNIFLDKLGADPDWFEKLLERGVIEAISRSDNLYEAQCELLRAPASEIAQHAYAVKKMWRESRQEFSIIKDEFPELYRRLNDNYAEMRLQALRNLFFRKRWEAARSKASKDQLLLQLN